MAGINSISLKLTRHLHGVIHKVTYENTAACVRYATDTKIYSFSQTFFKGIVFISVAAILGCVVVSLIGPELISLFLRLFGEPDNQTADADDAQVQSAAPSQAWPWGIFSAPFEPGQPVGLPGGGNNCFLNAALQLLAHSPDLQERLKERTETSVPELIEQFNQAYQCFLEKLNISCTEIGTHFAITDVVDPLKGSLANLAETVNSFKEKFNSLGGSEDADKIRADLGSDVKEILAAFNRIEQDLVQRKSQRLEEIPLLGLKKKEVRQSLTTLLNFLKGKQTLSQQQEMIQEFLNFLHLSCAMQDLCSIKINSNGQGKRELEERIKDLHKLFQSSRSKINHLLSHPLKADFDNNNEFLMLTDEKAKREIEKGVAFFNKLIEGFCQEGRCRDHFENYLDLQMIKTPLNALHEEFHLKPKKREVLNLMAQFFQSYEDARRTQKTVTDINANLLRKAITATGEFKINDRAQHDANILFLFLFNGENVLYPMKQIVGNGESTISPMPMILIPQESNKNIQQLFNEFFVENGSERKARSFFPEVPKGLLLQLKRSNGSAEKNNDPVEVPEKLNLSGQLIYTPGGMPPLEDTEYTLDSFIVHEGSSTNWGHFVAYLKIGEQWWGASDASVYKINSSKMKEELAKSYILHFKKAEPAASDPPSPNGQGDRDQKGDSQSLNSSQFSQT